MPLPKLSHEQATSIQDAKKFAMEHSVQMVMVKQAIAHQQNQVSFPGPWQPDQFISRVTVQIPDTQVPETFKNRLLGSGFWMDQPFEIWSEFQMVKSLVHKMAAILLYCLKLNPIFERPRSLPSLSLIFAREALYLFIYLLGARVKKIFTELAIRIAGVILMVVVENLQIFDCAE